jgi:type VI secretion system secreted protein VgrG
VAAGEKISLFAQKLGIKIFASKGPVDVQAQSGPMSLTSDKDMSIATVNGTARIVAKTELILECGGAFIQLKDGSITLGGPFDLFFKVITIQKQGKASMHIPVSLPPVPIEQDPAALYTQTFDVDTVAANHGDGLAVDSRPYRVYLPDGTIQQQGALVEGSTFSVSTAEPVKVRCEIGVGDWSVVAFHYTQVGVSGL